MKNPLTLLKIEWLKLKNNVAVLSLLAIHGMLFILLMLSLSTILNNISEGDAAAGAPGIRALLDFPMIWGPAAWLASWFNIILSVCFIALTGAEINQRLLRQNLIDGLKPHEIFTGKLLLAFGFALYSFLLVFSAAFIAAEGDNVFSFRGTEILVVYLLQTMAFMILALFLISLIKNTAFSIIFMFLIYPLEFIIRLFFDDQIAVYFPLKAISTLTPMPFVEPDLDFTVHVATVIIYMTIFGGFFYFNLRRKRW